MTIQYIYIYIYHLRNNKQEKEYDRRLTIYLMGKENGEEFYDI